MSNEPCPRTMHALRRIMSQGLKLRVQQSLERHGIKNKALATTLAFEFESMINSIGPEDMPPKDDGKVRHQL